MRDIRDVVSYAQSGDREALAEVVSRIQDTIYRLSVRMLADATAAEDATQEILVLVITGLSQFRGQSRFSTWVYRVAVNHLLTAKKIQAREFGLTFEDYGEDLEDGLEDSEAVDPTDIVMFNELRVACTMAMLLCLDMDHRIAYVLGRILELSQSEAVEILELPAATYRKRVSRASAKVEAFTAKRCGVVSPGVAKCSCPRRLPKALEMQRVDPTAPLTRGGADAPTHRDVLEEVSRAEASLRGLCAQRLVPEFRNPRNFTQKLEQILADRTGSARQVPFSKRSARIRLRRSLEQPNIPQPLTRGNKMPTRKAKSKMLAMVLCACTAGASFFTPSIAEESAKMTKEETAVLNVIETMTSSFAKADIHAVMNTYEPDAVILFEPGVGTSDEEAVRQSFAQFASMNPSFSYGGHQVVVAGDVGLHISPWQMEGTGPDGNAFETGGLSVAVLRKQPDGKWLMVIDNPYGNLHLDN